MKFFFCAHAAFSFHPWKEHLFSNYFTTKPIVRFAASISLNQSNKTDIRKGKGATMPVWLQIVAANTVICLACYARAAHKAYKSTETELEEAKREIKYFKNELRIANMKIEGRVKKPTRDNQIPDLLLADDPLEALLNEVGKVRE